MKVCGPRGSSRRGLVAAAAVLAALGCADGDARGQSAAPACEGCAAPEAPGDLGPVLVIPPEGEPGERLVLEGTVYQADGRTPASGVLVYAYHTNASGIYPKRGDESGNARRHGYLRGWLRTGADGRYRIETVKPGSYPGGGPPAHVHMTVQPPGGQESFIDEVEFEGDPRLTPAHRGRLAGRGGSGIVPLERLADGTLHARRDILLGRL